jgi:8-oxo-dGTP pyrophosphatase MutT (NUDIX family)
MPMSEYVARLRSVIGHELLLLPAVTAVIEHDGRYLLARHVDDGRWGLIGGGIEPLEAPVDALRREVREELGIDLAIQGVIGSYGGPDLIVDYPNGDRVAYVTTAYLCRPLGLPHVAEPDEIAELAWFGLDEVLRLDRQPWIERVLLDARAS